MDWGQSLIAAGVVTIVLAVINATMDEIQFHWDRSFKKLFKVDSNAEQWFNPHKSWLNKWRSKSKVVNWLMSVPFVFVTDFWHALKFLFLNIIFGYITIAGLGQTKFLDILAGFIIFNILWGIFFETTMGIWGGIGSIKRK